MCSRRPSCQLNISGGLSCKQSKNYFKTRKCLDIGKAPCRLIVRVENEIQYIHGVGVESGQLAGSPGCFARDHCENGQNESTQINQADMEGRNAFGLMPFVPFHYLTLMNLGDKPN